MSSRDISNAAFWADLLNSTFGPASLVRIGQNAIWHAREAGLAIRIYRSQDAWCEAEREIAVSDLLVSAGVPTIRAAASTPLILAGRPATLWHWVASDEEAVDAETFGKLLGSAHRAWTAQPAGIQWSWAPLDPLAKVAARLDRISALGEAALIQERYNSAMEIWKSFQSALPWKMVHGDAHRGNAIPTPQGLVLCDFDETRLGPIEWDLVSFWVGHLRFGTPWAEMEAFARGLQASPELVENARNLVPIKELSAISWLAVRAVECGQAHHELRRRLGLSIEGGGAIWRAF
jgi:Ser/Thr protein kinase RdoA (MazF antagonist)